MLGTQLFDKVGALGLTSFMQEVTRARALEGELARTIQLIRGVKAARVHIVLPDEGSFRRPKQPPSASVTIRTENPDDASAAQAIRHLVASSLPGMTADQVTVLNTDGMILSASDGESADAGPSKALTLEKSIARDIQENVRRTLAACFKLPNFQVSVRARVNTDRRQTNETSFDPDSRVERSVRTTKETSQSQNSAATQATSVERNIPQDRGSAVDGKQSADESRKSEELTNFELSSKTITTVSSGYNLEHLSVAVLVNRTAFTQAGKASMQPETLEKQIAEIEQLVFSAAGMRKERGDTLKVTAVDFVLNESDMSPVEGASAMTLLGRHLDAILNALTALGIAAIIVGFGLAPARRALVAQGSQLRLEPPPLLASDHPKMEMDQPEKAPHLLSAPGQIAEEAIAVINGSARRQLEKLIEMDDSQAAAVMKQWMRSRTELNLHDLSSYLQQFDAPPSPQPEIETPPQYQSGTETPVVAAPPPEVDVQALRRAFDQELATRLEKERRVFEDELRAARERWVQETASAFHETLTEQIDALLEKLGTIFHEFWLRFSSKRSRRVRFVNW